MKKLPLLLSAALAGGAASMPSAAFAQTVVPHPQTMPTTVPAPAEQANSPAQAIENAADPSTAIAAYAKAMAIDHNDLAAEKAYLQRMVSFGLPEMAEAQAKDVIQRDPNDGLAWAVVAYISAKRDDTPAALAAIVAAAKHSPNDVFVLRTAGQIVAWYDLHSDKSQIPDSVRQSIATMRKDLEQRQTYLDAYSDARKTYSENVAENEQSSATTAPSEAAAPATAGLPPDYSAPDEGLSGDYYYPAYYPSYPVYTSYAPVWTDPYAYAYYPGYSYWYPSGWYPGYWWWPSFSFSFGFFDFDHHHDDFDHHHHGDFDHNGHQGNHHGSAEHRGPGGHGQVARGHGPSFNDVTHRAGRNPTGNRNVGGRSVVSARQGATPGHTGTGASRTRVGVRSATPNRGSAPGRVAVGSAPRSASALRGSSAAPARGTPARSAPMRSGSISSGGRVGGPVGGFSGSRASGLSAGRAGGFSAGRAGGLSAGHAGGFSGGHAGGFSGGRAGGFSAGGGGGHAGGFGGGGGHGGGGGRR